MKVFTIDKKDWDAGIEKAKSTYQVFGPVKEKEWHSSRPSLRMKNRT